MAAVEGIPDQGTDVIQKHVPQNSNGDSCPETVLSNGESNETSMECDSVVVKIKQDLPSENKNPNDITSEDVEMADAPEIESKAKLKDTLELDSENRTETGVSDLTSDDHHEKINLDKETSEDEIASTTNEESHAENDTIVISSGDDTKEIGATKIETLSNGFAVEGKLDEHVAENLDVPAEKTDIEDCITVKQMDVEEDCSTAVDENLIGKECLKQESLFKKLGFNPVKNVPVESICNAKIENASEGNGSSSNGIASNCVPSVLPSTLNEKLLDEISENVSNASSRCSSPGFMVDGVPVERDQRKSRRLLEQKALIDILKEDLRSEEAKLLLLRKLMESSRKNGSIPLHKIKENNSRLMPSLHPKSRMPGQTYPGAQQDGSSSIQIAPKIVIGSKGSSGGSNLPRVVPSIVPSGKTVSASSVSTTDSSYGTHAQMHSGVPVSTLITQPVHKYYIQVGSQLVPAAPPTCINQPVYAMPVYSNTTTSGTSKPKVNSTIASSGLLPKTSIQPVSADVQASKHSAAKAALRRQLEQTLLQIPPPRPPSADWRVIPNVNSMDFMMLVGLDEIVDMILEGDGKPTLKNILTDMLPKNPIICDQCGMDFSPLWKQKGFEKPHDILCEKCSLTNTKKDLKAEHTSRLKSAFLKALKQEQEIEEKIKAGEEVHIGSPPLQDKDSQGGTGPHHKPQSHLHSVHQPYKHQKVQKNSSEHRHQVVHRHHHGGVVQHYPHHSSLVHQLHQQHIQQQQVDYDPGTNSSRRNARWHPYVPSQHHHSSSSHVHNANHHRTFNAASSTTARSESGGRPEYYVVHHPQHSNSATRWGH